MGQHKTTQDTKYFKEEETIQKTLLRDCRGENRSGTVRFCIADTPGEAEKSSIPLHLLLPLYLPCYCRPHFQTNNFWAVTVSFTSNALSSNHNAWSRTKITHRDGTEMLNQLNRVFWSQNEVTICVTDMYLLLFTS